MFITKSIIECTTAKIVIRRTWIKDPEGSLAAPLPQFPVYSRLWQYSHIITIIKLLTMHAVAKSRVETQNARNCSSAPCDLY